MGRVTRGVPRTRHDLTGGHEPVTRPDTVVVEEPLQLRVGDVVVTTTMRTPGDDFDLAIGHLLTEGLLRSATDVATMRHCTDVDATGAPTYNVVDLTLSAGVSLQREPGVRTEVASSACGICGSETIDEVLTRAPYAIGQDPARLSLDRVPDLLASLQDGQTVFARTGGLHGAALFDVGGSLLVVREDIGRHNAVDKVIGWAARHRELPLTATVLVVSSRAGFEIVHKAAAAGIPVVVAVSAPSSLAVDLANRAGITLLAFAREHSVSSYARGDRLVPTTGQ